MSQLGNNNFGLRLYNAEDALSPEWIVSGVSNEEGKRWRKRFVCQEDAEAFYSREIERLRYLYTDAFDRPYTLDGVEERSQLVGEKMCQAHRDAKSKVVTSKRWSGSLSRRRLRLARRIPMSLVVLIAAGLLSACVIYLKNGTMAAFWSNFRGGGTFVDKPPARMVINVRPGGSISEHNAIEVTREAWRSVELSVESYQWYQIRFRSRVVNRDSVEVSSRGGLFEVVCLDDVGREGEVIASIALPSSTAWETCDHQFRISAPAARGREGESVAVRVRLRSEIDGMIYVDDLTLEQISHSQVLERADRMFDRNCVDVTYRPKISRWKRLPNALGKLQGRQKLRIAFGCDDRQRELSEVPLDAFLERLYPGATVEVFSIVCRGDTKAKWEQAADIATRLGVDVFVAGGIIEDESFAGLQSALDILRASASPAVGGTEMLILTNGWGANDEGASRLRLTSNARELDQEVAQNSHIPNDSRGRLLQFAAQNGLEFLDVMGIVGEIVFSESGLRLTGPDTYSDGVPYRFFTRDLLDPNRIGNQLLGRILEVYFSPSGDGTERAKINEQGSSSAAVPLFDPEQNVRDRNTFSKLKKEFGVSSVELPAFAREFRGRNVVDFNAAGWKNVRFRLSEDMRREIAFCFDEPLDARTVDILVYLSLRTMRKVGEERGRFTISVRSDSPTDGFRDDSGGIALTVKPNGAAVLGIRSESAPLNDVDHLLESPIGVFLDSTKSERFRLVFRWLGRQRISAEAAVWDERTNEWKGLIPFDRPGATPFVMEVSNVPQLLGSTAFRELLFETQSNAPILDSVLVTKRPSDIF